MKKLYPHITLPLLLGVGFLFIPLLRDFHFESAFLTAIIGSFWCGLASSKIESDHFKSTVRILFSFFLIGLPPLIFTLFSGCLTFDGFAFWILLPAPSAFFGTSIGRLFKLLNFRRSTLLTVITLSFVAIVTWMVEFFTLPQVYFFNHVWGMWPGPVYDETLTISGNLIFFRSITFLWIILLWVLPEWSKDLQNKLITGLTLISLMFCYLNLSEGGLITPREVLKDRLNLNVKTKHFDLFFDPDNFTEEEANYWSQKHEFYFDEVIEVLELDWPDERIIESYLYANAWQKKKLVGAKFTSYVPIWLEQDQLHIAKQQLEGVLLHELVHVISKQFGNRLYNGSTSIGLIEGIAEAIAKDASSESTLDQILAAENTYPNADEMKTALSNAGFYSSAASISYTTAGSFIQFLIENYPIQYFKEAYPDGDFESSYPVPFDSLIHQWHQHLDATEIDSVDRNISEFIFSRRSLFQKKCPHSFDEEFELWDEFNRYQSLDDSASALQTINQLYELSPENKLIKRDWVRQQLLHGNYEIAVSSFDESDSLLTLQLLKADALYLNAEYEKAQSLIESLKSEIQSSTARNFKYSYKLRSDSLNWHDFLSARYKNEITTIEEFQKLKSPVQILILSKATEPDNHNGFLSSGTKMIAQNTLDAHWFGIYEEIADQLIFKKNFNEADLLIDGMEELQPRQRYAERLDELKAWRNFVLSNFEQSIQEK